MSKFTKIAPLLLFCSLIFQSSCSGANSLTDENGNATQNTSAIEDATKNILYYDDKHIDYTNQDFDENIHTVLLHRRGSPISQPIISLGEGEQLTLKFDDFSEEVRDIYYTFEHCTYDWQKSDLSDMDYIRGFYNDQIFDYDFSFNTLTNYTNYALTFPNDNIDLTRSGNYIIKVYANDDPEEVLFTRRFMIYENQSNISANIKPSSVVADRDYRQELDFNVNITGIQVPNPYRDIKVQVLQNYSWNSAKGGVKPSFIKDQQLQFDFQNEFTFDGGNEYRYFDAKSVKYRTEQIQAIELENNKYHVYLAMDAPRPYSHYTFNNDLNGMFLIQNDDMIDADLESDYVDVHFYLKQPARLINGDLYVFGKLSDYEFKPEFKMKFNSEYGVYELQTQLKQGYYNYQYVFLPNNSNVGDITRIEGNHFDTENMYTILVYYSDIKTFSDRLIGFREINTINR